MCFFFPNFQTSNISIHYTVSINPFQLLLKIYGTFPKYQNDDSAINQHNGIKLPIHAYLNLRKFQLWIVFSIRLYFSR